jgi:hypothetical protein
LLTSDSGEEVAAALHGGAEGEGHHLLLGGADLGEPLRHRADRAVVLHQRAAAGAGRALGHVALGGAEAGEPGHPLRRGAGGVRRRAGDEPREVPLEQGHHRVAALPLRHALEEGGERLGVPGGEEGLRRRREAVGVGRGPDPVPGPAVLHQALGLELPEVVPHRVGGEADPLHQPPDRQPRLPLQLQQDGAARTPVSRDGGLGLGGRGREGRGTHRAGNLPRGSGLSTFFS